VLLTGAGPPTGQRCALGASSEAFGSMARLTGLSLVP
jgi:hypothetical protein